MSIAISDDLSRSMGDVESLKRVCELLMKTPHYAKLGAEGVFAVTSKARSLGMDLIEALNGGLYYLQGKVGMPAETMAALIRQKGHSITKDGKSDDSICILHGKRADTGDTWCVSFSIEDAKRAGIAKMMYDKYPAAMLYNRAMSFLARQLFPDVIKGAGYTFDELKEIAGGKNDPVNGVNNEALLLAVDSISTEQYEQLALLLVECSPEYQKKFWSFLTKEVPGIEKLEQLPAVLFSRISIALRKKRDEYQCSFNQEAAPSEEIPSQEVVNA